MSTRQSPPAERPALSSRPTDTPRRAPATPFKITAAQYKAWKKPRNKYGNKITTVDGIKFRSKKEAERYGQLKELQRGKIIKDLKLQPRFPLMVQGERVGLMIADFSYRWVTFEPRTRNDDVLVVEDVKGAKTLLWKLKWALAKVLYPHIDWRIT